MVKLGNFVNCKTKNAILKCLTMKLEIRGCILCQFRQRSLVWVSKSLGVLACDCGLWGKVCLA